MSRILLLLCLSITLFAGENLLKNPTFEGNPIAEWKCSPTGVSVSNGVVRLTVQPDGKPTVFEQSYLLAANGQRFLLSAEVRGEPGNRVRVNAIYSVGTYQKPVAVNADKWQTFTAPAEWTKIERIVEFSHDAIAKPRAGFYIYKGTAEMRNMSLVELPEMLPKPVKAKTVETLGAAGTLSRATGKNLLATPKLEGMPPVGWRSSAGVSIIDGVAKLTVQADGKPVTLDQTVNAIQPGGKYIIRCQARGEKGSRIRFCAYYAIPDTPKKHKAVACDNWTIVDGTDEWRTMEYKLEYPAEGGLSKPTVGFYVYKGVGEVRDIECFEDTTKPPEALGVSWQMGNNAKLLDTPDGHAVSIAWEGWWKPGAVLSPIAIRPGAHYRLRYEVIGVGKSDLVTGFHRYRLEYGVPGTDFIVRARFEDVWTSTYQGRTLKFVNLPPNADKVFINFCMADKTGRVAFRKLQLEEYTPEVVDTTAIVLESPVYRDAIYESVPVREIAGTVRANADVKSAQVQFVSPDGKLLGEKNVASGARFAFDSSKLTPGKYLLKASLMDGDGKVVRTIEKTITRYPKAPHEVVEGPNRTLYVDGKPFLPVLMDLSYGEDFYAYCAAHGINVSKSWVGRENSTFNVLEEAWKHGVRVVVSFMYSRKERKFEEWKEQIGALLSERVRNHPAVLCYFIADEPFWGGADPADLKKSYDFVRERDPYHPVWINFAPPCTLDEMRPYAKACDIGGFDVYPIPYPNAHSFLEDKTPSALGKYSQLMYDATDGQKSVLMYLQGFSWSHRDPKAKPTGYPNLTETRFMSYDSLLHKANAIGFWGTYQVAYPQFLHDIMTTATEMHQMSRLLLEANREMLPAPDGIGLHALTFNGQTYLIALNNTTKAVQDAALKTPFGTCDVTVFHENRKVAADGGIIHDSFEPFGVHVYGISPLPSPLWSLSTWTKNTHPLEDFCDNLINPKNRYRGKANWIWEAGNSLIAGSKAYLERTFTLTELPKEAVMLTAVDDYGNVSVNGKFTGEFGGWSKMRRIDMLPMLKVGENSILAVVADGGALPCGFIAEITITYANGTKTVILSDDQWLASPDGKAPAQPAKIITPYGGGAWKDKVELP